MAAPSLPGVDWNAAKAALAMGARLEDVAKDMGIKFRTLQKRAQRGNWLIAHTLIKRTQRERQRILASQGSPPTHPSTQDPQTPSQTQPQHPNQPETTAQPLPGLRLSNVSKVENEAQSWEKGGALVLQTLERNDERISVLASGMALKAVEGAAKRKKSLPINTVQDLDKAVMISKRAAGKDREESKVTVALFGGQGAQGPMIDAAKRFRVRIADAEVITGQDA